MQSLFASSIYFNTNQGWQWKTGYPNTIKSAVPRFISLIRSIQPITGNHTYPYQCHHGMENTYTHQCHHRMEWHQWHPRWRSEGGFQWPPLAEDVAARVPRQLRHADPETNAEGLMLGTSFNNHVWVQAQIITPYYIWPAACSGRMKHVWTVCACTL